MFKKYVQQLQTEFGGYSPKRLGQDAMAGLTVCAVALPLALAFGVSCGADAAAGLITAILAGVVISALSGASYQISGPTGAMTAVLVTIVAKYQLQGVFLVSFMAGVLLLIASLFKLGKLVSLIPGPVVTGFTSGIAIIIALGQIDNFFGTTSKGETAIQKLMSYGSLGFHPDWQAIVIGLLVIAVMVIWPKAWNARVPSSLVGIIAATIVSQVFGFSVTEVGEIPRTLLPDVRFDLFSIEWSSVLNLLSPAFTVAALAMIESLLCGASASSMKNEPFDADQELFAQGVGNMLIPFFGGVPATAAIARTSVAIKSGGQTRLTGIFHALFLLASMFILGPVMSKLPLAALAGVLMVTAWRMNEWHSIRYIFNKKFKSAIFQFLVTMMATVVFDLTIAILIGVLVSMILFVAKSTDLAVSVSKVRNEKLRGSDVDVESTHANTYVVYVTGPIFFGNVEKLATRLQELTDCGEIIFSLRGVPSIDTTGVQTFMNICRNCRSDGMRVVFCGVHDTVRVMMQRAGLEESIGSDAFYWSVDKALLEKQTEETSGCSC